MASLLPFLALSCLLAAVTGAGVVKKTECFADLEGDKLDPNNIYTCDVPQTCCQEKGLPTCCSEKSTSKAALDQAKLWGTLCLMIVILAVLMWYCRHDGDCCGNKSKCPCCKKGKDNSDDDDDDDDDDEEPIEKVKMPPTKTPPAFGDVDQVAA